MNLNWLQAALLGLIRGITEFLPTDAAAHGEIAARLIGAEGVSALAQLLMGAGALLAVIIVYAKLFSNMVKHPVRSLLPELAAASAPWLAAALLTRRRASLVAVWVSW